jgi:hypothetical protein
MRPATIRLALLTSGLAESVPQGVGKRNYSMKSVMRTAHAILKLVDLIYLNAIFVLKAVEGLILIKKLVKMINAELWSVQILKIIPVENIATGDAKVMILRMESVMIVALYLI